MKRYVLGPVKLLIVSNEERASQQSNLSALVPIHKKDFSDS
jgi:hypothetical protein